MDSSQDPQQQKDLKGNSNEDNNSEQRIQLVWKYSEETREDKRQKLLKQNRALDNQMQKESAVELTIPTDEPTLDILNLINGELFQPDHLEGLIEALNSSDLYQQLRGCIGIRCLLMENSVLGPKVVRMYCLPRIYEFIKIGENETLKLEAIKSLCEISESFYSQEINPVDEDLVTLILRNLDSPYLEITRQSMTTLGNVARSNTNSRNLILQQDGITQILLAVKRNISRNPDIPLLRNFSSSMRIIFQRPLPKIMNEKDIIQVLCLLIIRINDEVVKIDCLWTLFKIMEMSSKWIDRVIYTGVIPSLFTAMRNTNSIAILVPIIRILGEIAAGSEEQTNHLALNEFIPILKQFIEHPKKAIRKQVCWLISNIAGGSQVHKQLIIEEPGLLQLLFNKVKNDPEEIVQEVLWIFKNLSEGDCIPKLVEMGLIELYAISFHSVTYNASNMMLVLNSIQSIFEYGQSHSSDSKNLYVEQAVDKGLINFLEQMQLHTDLKVYELSTKIIDKYFADLLQDE